MPLLEFTDCGIYCRKADVYIDPWKRVDRALITHAHSDHARWGMKWYLAHPISIPVMRLRLGVDIKVEAIDFGQSRTINGVKFTFYPAGHIPGSCQIRAEYKGEIWVVTGDYKLEDDGISDVWEPVQCQHFITESTFGMPVYKWPAQEDVFADIHSWWRKNQEEGRCSVLSAYSLGKAQRILRHLDSGQGPILVHGAVYNTNEVLAEFYPFLKKFAREETRTDKALFRNAMVIAPPSAQGTPWMQKFGATSSGVCSGWMAIRGARRRRAVDRGFILSDHCDWPSLNTAVAASGAEDVYVTHGYTATYARYLNENMPGVRAAEVHTLFGDDFGEEEEDNGQITEDNGQSSSADLAEI